MFVLLYNNYEVLKIILLKYAWKMFAFVYNNQKV